MSDESSPNSATVKLMESKIKSLESQNKNYEETIEGLRGRLEAANLEISTVKALEAEAQGSIGRLTELEDENKMLTEKIRKVTSEIDVIKESRIGDDIFIKGFYETLTKVAIEFKKQSSKNIDDAVGAFLTFLEGLHNPRDRVFAGIMRARGSANEQSLLRITSDQGALTKAIDELAAMEIVRVVRGTILSSALQETTGLQPSEWPRLKTIDELVAAATDFIDGTDNKDEIFEALMIFRDKLYDFPKSSSMIMFDIRKASESFKADEMSKRELISRLRDWGLRIKD
ncbi:MAG: hypothetical protein ACTSYA_03720 [Candidatus Kariarchaeaceae archaeon]